MGRLRLRLAPVQGMISVAVVRVFRAQQMGGAMHDDFDVFVGIDWATQSHQVCLIATPSELYEAPRSKFVADFIGRMTMIPGRIGERQNGSASIDLSGLGAISCETNLKEGSEETVGIRPEKIEVLADEPSHRSVKFQGTVTDIVYVGGESHFYVTAGQYGIISYMQNASKGAHAAFSIGQTAWCAWDSTDMVILEQWHALTSGKICSDTPKGSRLQQSLRDSWPISPRHRPGHLQ